MALGFSASSARDWIGCGCWPEMQRSLALMLWKSIFHSPGLTTGPCVWPTRSNFSWTRISFGPAERDLIHDAISSLLCQLWTWKWVKDSGLIHKNKKKKHTSTPNKPTLIRPYSTLPPISGQNGHTQPWGMRVPGHKVIKSTQLHARRKRILRNSSVLCATLHVPVGFCISYQDHSIWSESVLEIDPLHSTSETPLPTHLLCYWSTEDSSTHCICTDTDSCSVKTHQAERNQYCTQLNRAMFSRDRGR